ncbi:MAG: sigma-54-dependent Fis family transcriptional regulator [candidate division Zixibacteria bacterium]|nr:sigma-54-dependent Fis family transcriptional regulator [candidate division Zixibacteria bacterium]
MTRRIFIVDDEESMCNFMAIMLQKEGYEVETSTDGRQAVDRICNGSYDLVITDMMMPEMSGLELLGQVKKRKTEQDFIVMTAFASVESAIEAMKIGAADYVTKPFKIDEIKLTIDKVLSHNRIIGENITLRKQLAQVQGLDSIIGVSESIMKLKEMIRQVAKADSTILIRGESGTGKDLVARAIHTLSDRNDGRLVSINCAAIPETLLESELFGHGKGAFTGAISSKDGHFKAADGGTFFLDEIGDTSPSIQVKLLRVIEEKRITPIGETQPIDIDVRLITATNANLEQEVQEGRFRADLFYRLNVIPIVIDPLRDRTDDIPILIDHFVEKFCRRHNLGTKVIQPEIYNMLAAYSWPGNVRELENTIERAVLLNKGTKLESDAFPDIIIKGKSDSLVGPTDHKTPSLEFIEKAYIHWVLDQSEGNKSKAARTLGIDTSTLYRKLEKYKSGLNSNKKDK